MTDRDRATDPAAIEPVLEAIGNKYAARILAAAERPMSAQELSNVLGVPIATCYRRIEELEAVDLLVCVGGKTSDRGRHASVYRRTVDGIELDFEDGTPGLSADARSTPPDPLRERRDE